MFLKFSITISLGELKERNRKNTSYLFQWFLFFDCFLHLLEQMFMQISFFKRHGIFVWQGLVKNRFDKSPSSSRIVQFGKKNKIVIRKAPENESDDVCWCQSTPWWSHRSFPLRLLYQQLVSLTTNSVQQIGLIL